MLPKQNRLKSSRSQPRSSSKSNFDPFTTLQKQGNKLKPVSPKLKLPGRPPHSKILIPKSLNTEENQVETPRFSTNPSPSTASTRPERMKKRRYSGRENYFQFFN